MKITPITLLVTIVAVVNARTRELRNGHPEPIEEPEPIPEERPKPMPPPMAAPMVPGENIATVTEVVSEWAGKKLQLRRYTNKCIGFPDGYYDGSLAKAVHCASAPKFLYDNISQRLQVEGTTYCLDAYMEDPQAWECDTYTEQKWVGIRVPNNYFARWAIYSLHYGYTLDDSGNNDVSIEDPDDWMDLDETKIFDGLGESFFY